MRWLVEVSRVSDGSSSERYCIDARRWQSALQEVRRLRGDEGPLPKLTIELLDSGYRAVDPELKVRYVVTEAPAGMPVTAGAQVRHSTQPPPDEGGNSTTVPAPPKAPVSATPPASEAPKPTASVPVSAPHPSDAPGAQPSAQLIRQRDESPTAESPIHYRELALAVRPGAAQDGVEALMRARLEQAKTSLNAGDAQQYVQIAIFDHMFVKRPVRPPIATLAWKNWRGDPVLAFPGYAQKAKDSTPDAVSTRQPSWTPPSEPAQESAKPTSVAPAPVVAVGAAPAAVMAPTAAPAPAALVSPPVAPTATVPRPGATSGSSPPSTGRSSVIPAPVVSVGARAEPKPPAAPPAAPADAEIPVPLVARRLETPRKDELDIAVEVGTPSAAVVPSAPVIDVAVASAPLSDLPASSQPAAPPAPAPERTSSVPPARSSPAPSGRPGSIPGIPRRREPGEDLIGELFERMHELAFMADMVSGAEFVLRVLGELIPCEGILVHVFDLGKREFVVVRAQGPNARGALLHRTADHEPLVRSIMSRRGAVVLDGAPQSPPPASSSLSKLGVEPRAVLCGAARLGGRYLGLIELANPAGGHPFHDGESNALDYVCEQFAEFVASRPIIFDADVVVGAQ